MTSSKSRQNPGATTGFQLEDSVVGIDAGSWVRRTAEYPRLPARRAIHDEMRLHIAQMVEAVGIAPDRALVQALDLLIMWLIEHIHTEDQAMARHFKRQLSPLPSC